MMQTENQALNIPSGILLEKPAPPQTQMNSQGELMEVTQPEASIPAPQEQEQDAQKQDDWWEEISLRETALSEGFDQLYAPTDDTGMEHKIISCGHVLKSTHDLARWSEKTGTRRVNGAESIDAVSDLAVNLDRPANQSRRNNASNGNNSGDISGLFQEAPAGGRNERRGNRGAKQQWQPIEKSEVIKCWPVLKSTHDQAQLSEKRGKNAVNRPETSELLDELASNQRARRSQKSQQPSQIINSWPVLKSTHDQATWSEKRGANAVNKDSGAENCLDELAAGQQGGGPVQAGGSSLQSGLDTQGGSHVQLENEKFTETPEQAMAELHLHV